MAHLLTNGPHEAEPVDELEDLRKDVAQLRKDFNELYAAYSKDRQQFARLYGNLQSIFSKSGSESVAQSAGVDDKWERVKQRVGGKMSEIIEALQINEPATRTQLKNITGGRTSTVDQAIYKLRDMGLIVNSSEGWRLKQ